MFSTVEVGKKIAKLRKENNMTQMELADLMGVSFQAVSNWERGNSMPDISKLPELADLFHVSIDFLLGDASAANIIKKVQEKLPLSVEEDLQDYVKVAPMIKPNDTTDFFQQIEEDFVANKVDLKDLVSIAPFVDEDFFDTIAASIEVSDIDSVIGIAPFMSDKALDTIAKKFDSIDDIKKLVSLAPFLDEEILNNVVSKIDVHDNINAIVSLAPFLSDAALDKVVSQCINSDEISPNIVNLAPFLSDATVDSIAIKIVNSKDYNAKLLSSLAPFVSNKTLKYCAEILVKTKGFSSISSIAPFL